MRDIDKLRSHGLIRQSTRRERVEDAAWETATALEHWLARLPGRYVGKPLTQDDVTVIADSANRLREALGDRRYGARPRASL